MTRFILLIQINREAFEDKHFHTAYHVLAAALSCARYENSIEGAEMVMTIAEAQDQWIDENAPEYEHSRHSAHLRGLTEGGVFTMLTRQALLTLNMMQATDGL